MIRDHWSLEMLKIKKIKSGFSLIEVAIAVVVIGLLASFTIKGGKLIQSAKLNSVYDQVTTFKVATQLFMEKYGFLPGDLPNANEMIKAGVESGHGDGKISSLDDAKRFWNHLVNSGFLNSELTDGYPSSKIGGHFYVSNNLNDHEGLWVILANGTNDNLNFQGIITTENAHSIDRNNDTGDPTTGEIQILKGQGASGECIVGTKYNYQNKNKDCVLIFKILD